MKRFLFGLSVLIATMASLSFADIQKNIFDDDWTPPAPPQVKPPDPVPPATVPDPTSAVKTPKPIEPIVTPSAAPVPVRLPVPAASTQADAWKLIKGEIYKADIARATTPALKVELARKLMGVAQATKKDAVGKYVLFANAKELAISSGDPTTAFKCLDEMGKAFEIDYPTMKLDLFAAMANTVKDPADSKLLVDGLNRWADGQVKGDRFAAAKKACEIALNVARKNHDSKSANLTSQHQKQIGEIETSFAAAKTAMAALSAKPTDPAANLTVGRFYCLMKGDWGRGLPLLAKSDDPKLKALAEKELAGVSGAEAQMALGDGWWDAAENEKPMMQRQLRLHAADFYVQSKAGLEGLMLAKAEKRIDEVRKLDDPPPTVGAANKWVLIFHSSDPAIWNTDSKDKRNFAIPISEVDKEIAFLKMQIDAANFVIIPITREKLGVVNDQDRFGWEGRNAVVWGGRQLGIFDRTDVGEKREPGWVCIYYDTHGHSGWGWGYRAGINEQGFSWGGKYLGQKVCEIYVTTGNLTAQEKPHLLKPAK